MAVSELRGALDRRNPTASHVVTLVGFALIGVGAVLPWADKTLPVKVYVVGTRTGLERIWVRRLLVVAGVGLLVEVGRFVTADWRSVLDPVLVGIGAVIAAITVGTSPLTGPWTPARGVYVTLLGSLLVTLGAATTLVTTRLAGDSRTRRSTGD